MRLQPVSRVCAFLGKSPKDLEDLRLSGLPIAMIPGKVKPVPRVIPAAFFRWMAGRLNGDVTPEDVRRDFEDYLTKEGKS